MKVKNAFFTFNAAFTMIDHFRFIYSILIKKGQNKMKKITRRFYSTTIYPVAIFMRDGQIEKEDLDPIVIEDKLDLEKAEKIAKKAYKEKTVIVEDLVLTDELRGMSTETFLKHSEVIEEKEKDVKESEA